MEYLNAILFLPFLFAIVVGCATAQERELIVVPDRLGRTAVERMDITIDGKKWHPTHIRLGDVRSSHLKVELWIEQDGDGQKIEQAIVRQKIEQLELRLYISDPGRYRFTKHEGPIFMSQSSRKYSYQNREGVYVITKREGRVLAGECQFQLKNGNSEVKEFQVDFEIQYHIWGMQLH